MEKVEINCETNETQIIPLTQEEIATIERLQAEAQEREAARLAEEQALAETKAQALAKLQSLGLTEEEATALIR